MTLFVAAVSVALVVSFLCSIFESVLLSIRQADVEALAREGRRPGLLLRRFKRDIDVPIAAILIVNTIAHTVGSAVAGASYEDAFNAETLWIFTVVFTAAVLLFTEIIPKTLGVAHARRLATPVAFGIQALTVVLAPLVFVSERISKRLRGGHASPVTSIEEIRLLAVLGRNEGSVGYRTAEMIVGATRLRQLRAGDVMVPRPMVVFLSGIRDREAILATVRASGFSRFPFTPTDELDDCTGIVLARDLLFHVQDHPDAPIDWPAVVREPLIVTESQPVHALLHTFQQARSHLALVVDEYGQVEGVVTNEDVLEEVVGEIWDESDRPLPVLATRPDGSVEVLATTELGKLRAALGMTGVEDSDAATVGGLVTERLGRLPVAGDAVEWQGHRFEVLAANRRRAERIAIHALPAPEIGQT